MGNHLVKGRVQRWNAIDERWELYDVAEERVLARSTHKWFRVRLDGAPRRVMRARVEAAA